MTAAKVKQSLTSADSGKTTDPAQTTAAVANAATTPKCGLWGCGRRATTTATIACAGMESRDIVICSYHAQMFLSADKEPRP